MKMVKSLLLGSAAGLVAVAGAQAADLPVKAKPVQYVKICTLYGDGFYYIPGTDTCIKFSGYVRADYGWNTNNNGTDVSNSGSAGTQDRGSPNFTTRHRARFEVDTRTQTGYGTLRNFEAIQIENSTFGGNAAVVTRAFIQWAGFTFGHAQSLSDTWDLDDSWRYIPQENSGSTGANGVNQIAYTWELGNGMSLTVGADEAARKPLANLSSATALKIGGGLPNSFAAEKWPDPYVAFNVNQAWGRIAAAVRAHDVSATYYSGPGTGPFTGTVCLPTAQPSTTQCGHPDDKVGWGAAIGAEFKMDFITPGDRLGMSVHYGEGHSSFVNSRITNPGLFDTGNTGIGFGWVSDGVFVNGSGIQLMTSWTVQAGYEHYWTPTLKTSFSAAYSENSYNGAAQNWFRTQMGGVCAVGLGATGAATSTTVAAGAVNACSPHFQYLQGGIRTQWNVTKSFFLGVDVAYNRVFTAFQGAGAILSPAGQSGLRPTGAYAFDDQGEFVATFRAFSAF
jgi:hypothetical protein